MTEIIKLKTLNSCSDIYIGGNYQTAFDLTIKYNTVIITDKNIYALYPEIFKHHKSIVIEPFENQKNFNTILKIWNFFQENNIDKNSFVLGIGGGLISDITGFAASTWMRGVKFGFVATSLLSQVDAAIGGKNGINFNELKNCIGIIRQPEFVISAIEMLKTLNKTEFLSGLSESIKIALISDKNLYNFIEENHIKILNLDKEALEKCIYDSVKLKVQYVQEDENENHKRKELNFGHTLAHAIETQYNINHGLAVARGMIFASKFSMMKNYCSEHDFERIKKLLESLNYPINLKYETELIMQKILHDKKKTKNNIDFVFIEKIGKAKIENIEYLELKKALYDLC